MMINSYNLFKIIRVIKLTWILKKAKINKKYKISLIHLLKKKLIMII